MVAEDQTTPETLVLVPLYSQLLMQDRVQQRSMNLYLAVVADKTQLPEFIHERTNPGSRRANHLCQGPLIEICIDRLRATLLAEVGEKEKKTRQSLLSGIEQLIYQILLNPAVPG